MEEVNREEEKKIIPFHPTAEYFFQKGMNWYQKGELDRASKYLGRALKIKPNDVEFLCQQAAILSEMEEYEHSIELLQRVVYEIDSRMTECHFFMANNYAYLGDFDSALQEIHSYMTLDPNGAFMDEARELFEMLSEEMEEMVRIDNEPDYIRVHEKGRMALEHGHFEEAIRFFKRVIQAEPDFLAARNNLSVAYFSMGETAVALNTAKEILNRDPGNIHTLCNLATFYYQIGEKELLNDVVHRLNILYPMNPEHCGKLGSTYLFIGYDEKAYYWLHEAKSRGVRPDQVFYFWMALAAFHLGDQREALQDWQQVNYFSNKPFHPFKYGKIQDMLFEPDAADNFMVKDLLERELHENTRAYQLFSLFYLSGSDDQNGIARLSEKGPNPMIQALAKRFLSEQQSGQTNDGLEIMRLIERLFGGEKEVLKRPELYNFWFIADSLLIHRTSNNDCLGWAATLIYLWGKEYGMRHSQKQVAARAGTTVYRIRKHVQELTQALEEQREETTDL
ncbi:MAG: tetratricopeptide repeat protein [Sporolactobacillus sp.]